VLLLAVSAASSRLHVGVRLLLPILPLLFVGASRAFALPRVRILAFVAAIAQVATGVLAHPHALAYFNPIAGGTARGHEWLLDSNLDWGQDLSEVPDYVRRHGLSTISLLYFGHVEPGLYGIDYRLPGGSPAPGTYVVSANFAMGEAYVAPDHGRTVSVPAGAPEWLRARKPNGRIGGSLWVYEVP
jgi:hypothetical protein